jgi:hypothetical protein
MISNGGSKNFIAPFQTNPTNRQHTPQYATYNNDHRQYSQRYHQSDAFSLHVIADTETKQRMLEILQVDRKFFEQEILYNLLQTLEDKHYDLANQKIFMFTNSGNLVQQKIKEYVPTDIYEIANYIGKTTNTDIFSCVMSLCSATAIAMRSRYQVRLDRNWAEPINLYILLAKNSGEKKSAITEMLKHPHRNFLSNRRNANSSEVQNTRLKRDVALKAAQKSHQAIISRHTDKMRKSGESLECIDLMIEELTRAGNKLSKHIPPKRTREEIFIDTTTSLGFAKKLKAQGETIALMEPEAGLLFSKFFKDYSLLTLLLKCYGSEQYQYDTSTPGRKIDLERPSMNILLMLQNRVLFELFENEFLMDVGFLPRTLPILGGKYEDDSLLGFPIILGDRCKDQDWMTLYETKIQSILEFTYTQDIDREIFDIPCEASARSILLDFERENTRSLEAGQYRYMVPFIRKLHGHAARITGSIHGWIFPRPHEHPITVKEVEAGIALAKICRDHASVAFDIKERETKKYAIKILKYLLRQDWTRSQPLISASDLQRNISGLNKAKCLPALDFLEQHNFIRQHHEPKYAPLCILHPNLFQVNLDHLTDI